MFFIDDDHRNFYTALVHRNKGCSVDYRRLFYLLSSTEDIRNHINDCLELAEPWWASVKTDALRHGWVTSSDSAIIRLAFNLFNGRALTAWDYDRGSDEYLRELEACTPASIFYSLHGDLLRAAITSLTLM